MVTINQGKCNGCGLCVRICHESCIELKGRAIIIDYNTCSTCGQCIAVCPAQALSWNSHPPRPFDKDRLPSPDQVDEMLKQRRTNRHFKDKKPDRKILEEIVTTGAYAPSHAHDFRVILIDDGQILRQMDQTVFNTNKKLYNYLFKPKIVRWLIRLLSSRIQWGEFLKAKPKLEKSMQIGRGYAELPPAVIFVVGNKTVPLSTESAQYVLYNMDLFSRTLGLGCRNLVGNQMFLNRSRQFRRLLGLKKKEKIFAAMGIGYPAIKFRNIVSGRELKIQWNKGQDPD
jgi:NAD-dependent dihydropyrimidine dehydrogenase PreA subunit/nitroreductase